MNTTKIITLQHKVNTLSADVHTPISLFMGFPTSEHAILLESAAVDGRWGRYSLLAHDAALFIYCRQGLLQLDIIDPQLKPLQEYAGMPYVAGLRALMKRIEVKEDSTCPLPPITRALYGYFGYGMAGILNEDLASVLPKNEAESCLMLPRTVLLFDHIYNKLYAINMEHNPTSIYKAPVFASHEHAAESANTHDISTTQTPNTEDYIKAVQDVRELLRQGEGIQVVLSMRHSRPYEGDCLPLYRALRNRNASPYMFYQRLPHITLFGTSPEVMVRCTAGHMELSPIAGTRPRGKDVEEDANFAAELLQDPKEKAEHTMLVDLGRNDLGRVAKAGSVVVEQNMEIQRFSHVMHMTSHLSAPLRTELDALDVLGATFPAGTVSGAPKKRAMEIIAAHEKQARGPYAGCVGWIGLEKDSVHLDMGIIIRSLWQREGQIHWQAGAGIVYDSEPATEAEECKHKGKIMQSLFHKTNNT